MWSYSILLIALHFATGSGLTAGTCKYKTPCACTMDDGKEINLASLGKLEVIDTTSKNQYIWKPCKNFDIGTLKGVTFVQYAQTTKTYFEVGSDPNVKFAMESGKVMLMISANAKAPNNRKGTVVLTCANETSLTFYGEAPSLSYNFELKSQECCPSKPGGGSSGLSIGSILTIVFFVLLIIYIIIGVLYQVNVKHSEGSERIPNVGFWSALPGLIKDGFKFTVSCGNPNSRVYSKI